jgi:hypothetical protein
MLLLGATGCKIYRTESNTSGSHLSLSGAPAAVILTGGQGFQQVTEKNTPIRYIVMRAAYIGVINPFAIAKCSLLSLFTSEEGRVA